MQLVIHPNGSIRCLYTEAIDLHQLGSPTMTRASVVDPDKAGRWWCDLAVIDGPTLGPFPLRSDALRAESAWLAWHWLTMPD